MAGVSFGFVPVKGVLYLSRYSDFVNELISSTGAWPDGAVIDFRFLPANSTTWIIWPATITGPTATWDVDKVDVATVLAAGASQYLLFYTQGTADLEWSKGPIVDVST
jgi:hypothetical protein